MTREQWYRDVLAPARLRSPERQSAFRTTSGYDIAPVYGPDDSVSADTDGTSSSGDSSSGDAPGPRAWTVSAVSGFGSSADANAHFHRLIAAGVSGLTVCVDGPTSVGLDPDDPRVVGGQGQTGVSVASADDVEEMFAGVDLAHVPVTLAVHDIAPILFALLLASEERSGRAWRGLRGALYHDIFSRDTHPQAGFSRALSLRLANDVFAFCHRHVPGVCAVTIGTGVARARGATPQQELSAVFAAAIRCLDEAAAGGSNIDDVVPLMAFRLGPHPDLFEDVARRRAARRIWARVVWERFAASPAATEGMRIICDTAVDGRTDGDPLENSVRSTYYALAAVLGGTTELTAASAVAGGDTSSAGQILSLRGQQVLASESGLGSVGDPLAGSWWIERLTADIVERTMAELERVEPEGEPLALGGEPEWRSEGHPGRSGLADRVRAYRATREPSAVDAALAVLRSAARGGGNIMEALVGAAKAGATVGEMAEVLRVAGRAMESQT